MAVKSKKKKALKGKVAGIFIEDVDSKLDMILEVVKGSEGRVESRIASLENKVDEIKEDLHESIRGIRMILEVHDKELNKQRDRLGTLEKEAHH